MDIRKIATSIFAETSRPLKIVVHNEDGSWNPNSKVDAPVETKVNKNIVKIDNETFTRLFFIALFSFIKVVVNYRHYFFL
tara:strand:- start:926 stop:1165 length:240 start_codon:yes stop_codon:yes gene_type:complete